MPEPRIGQDNIPTEPALPALSSVLLTDGERRVIAASLAVSMSLAETLGETQDVRDLGALWQRMQPPDTAVI